jgi:hypothetical protein
MEEIILPNSYFFRLQENIFLPYKKSLFTHDGQKGVFFIKKSDFEKFNLEKEIQKAEGTNLDNLYSVLKQETDIINLSNCNESFLKTELSEFSHRTIMCEGLRDLQGRKESKNLLFFEESNHIFDYKIIDTNDFIERIRANYIDVSHYYFEIIKKESCFDFHDQPIFSFSFVQNILNKDMFHPWVGLYAFMRCFSPYVNFGMYQSSVMMASESSDITPGGPDGAEYIESNENKEKIKKAEKEERDTIKNYFNMSPSVLSDQIFSGRGALVDFNALERVWLNFLLDCSKKNEESVFEEPDVDKDDSNFFLQENQGELFSSFPTVEYGQDFNFIVEHINSKIDLGEVEKIFTYIISLISKKASKNSLLKGGFEQYTHKMLVQTFLGLEKYLLFLIYNTLFYRGDNIPYDFSDLKKMKGYCNEENKTFFSPHYFFQSIPSQVDKYYREILSSKELRSFIGFLIKNIFDKEKVNMFSDLPSNILTDAYYEYCKLSEEYEKENDNCFSSIHVEEGANNNACNAKLKLLKTFFEHRLCDDNFFSNKNSYQVQNYVNENFLFHGISLEHTQALIHLMVNLKKLLSYENIFFDSTSSCKFRGQHLPVLLEKNFEFGDKQNLLVGDRQKIKAYFEHSKKDISSLHRDYIFDRDNFCCHHITMFFLPFLLFSQDKFLKENEKNRLIYRVVLDNDVIFNGTKDQQKFFFYGKFPLYVMIINGLHNLALIQFNFAEDEREKYSRFLDEIFIQLLRLDREELLEGNIFHHFIHKIIFIQKILFPEGEEYDFSIFNAFHRLNKSNDFKSLELNYEKSDLVRKIVQQFYYDGRLCKLFYEGTQNSIFIKKSLMTWLKENKHLSQKYFCDIESLINIRRYERINYFLNNFNSENIKDYQGDFSLCTKMFFCSDSNIMRSREFLYSIFDTLGFYLKKKDFDKKPESDYLYFVYSLFEIYFDENYRMIEKIIDDEFCQRYRKYISDSDVLKSIFSLDVYRSIESKIEENKNIFRGEKNQNNFRNNKDNDQDKKVSIQRNNQEYGIEEPLWPWPNIHNQDNSRGTLVKVKVIGRICSLFLLFLIMFQYKKAHV